MNTRVYHLEDAARLAMGNFIADETPPVSWLPRPGIMTLAIVAAVALCATGVLYLP